MSAAQKTSSSHGNSFLAAAHAWNRFWFNPADPTTLALIRICGGLLVFYVHLAYTYDLQTIFGQYAWTDAKMMAEVRTHFPVLQRSMGWTSNPDLPDNPTPAEKELMSTWEVNPRVVYSLGRPYLWSIWYHVTDPTWMVVVHGLILVAMFCFMIGFCTRVMAVLTWAGMLSYIQRGISTLFGMDTIMIIVVLYLMIGPSGAALSVDRLIARYWAAFRARRKHLPVPNFPKPAPSVSANLAIRLLQVHVCIVYFVSGTSKLMGPSWWSGYAVWMTMANCEFSPMGYRYYLEALRFIAARRWLWEMVTTGGTYFTLALEVSFPYLIWSRWSRPIVITAAVFMHLGIAICMGLVTFSMIMLVGVLSFVPPEAIHRLFRRVSHSLQGWQDVELKEAEATKPGRLLVSKATPV